MHQICPMLQSTSVRTSLDAIGCFFLCIWWCNYPRWWEKEVGVSNNWNLNLYGWWSPICSKEFYPQPLGKFSNLTKVFQMGWNYWLEMYIFLERMKSPSGMVLEISIVYSTYRMFLLCGFVAEVGTGGNNDTVCMCESFFLQRNVYQTITRYISLWLLLEYR